MRQRALFTHNDLDALVCALLTRIAMPRARVYFCDYNGFPSVIGSRIERFETIWIADVSIKSGDPLLDRLRTAEADVYWFDHHDSSAPQPWMAECRIDTTGTQCAADVLRGYVEEQGAELPIALQTLCDYAHDQDLWIRAIPEAQDFNDILGNMAIQELFDTLSQDLDRVYYWTDAMKSACQATQTERRWSLDLARRTCVEHDLPGGGTLRSVCCWGSTSEVGDEMGGPDIVVALLDLRSTGRASPRFSFRTQSDTIAVNKLAEVLGGGGHPKAAGAPIEIEVLRSLTEEVAQRVAAAATQLGEQAP
jgi:oligoribonuclease NrnB/cAMP/cGMP phosphodiesterase (DHH superfamily)